MSSLLAPVTITTAVTGVATSPITCRRGPPRKVTAQGNFIYGSGGATFKAWLQTSLDEGSTWTDIACFAFTTSSGRKVAAVNGATAVITAAAADGSLADNTILDGVLGDQFRVKYTSTNTYAGSTTFGLDIALGY